MGQRAREEALLELARRDTTEFPGACRAITEAAVVLVRVARASIWRIADGGRELVCDDLFLCDDSRHVSGQRIAAETCPAYFAALEASLAVRAQDAHHDLRTRELEATYLAPLGIGAMLDVPIWRAGRVYGVLCCEHVGGRRRWTASDERDAGRMAELVARALEASERRAAQEQWRIVAEAIPEIVVVVDASSRVVQSNTAARRTIQQEGGATFEGRFEDLEMRDLAGRLLARSEWPAERALHGETVTGEILEVSSKRTGQRRWFRVAGAPVRIADRIDSAVAVYADVGEEIRIEQLKRELLGSLAHELRTPTTIIKGYAQRLARRVAPTSEAASGLAVIVRAADRMGQLVDDLVDVSAITLGRIPLLRQSVDLRELVANAVKRAAPRHHVIRVVAAESRIDIVVDRARIEQLIHRLIDNATRFSPPGTEIEIEATVDGDRARVDVRDRGSGVPEERRAELFAPFSRTHSGLPRDVGGLGVGLFVAREIARRHGGSLEYLRREGGGSVFRLYLPLDGAGHD